MKIIENNKHSAKALAIFCLAVMCHMLMVMVFCTVVCFNNGDLIALKTQISQTLFEFISVLSAALTALTFYMFCSTHLQYPQYPTVTVPTVPTVSCSTHGYGA